MDGAWSGSAVRLSGREAAGCSWEEGGATEALAMRGGMPSLLLAGTRMLAPPAGAALLLSSTPRLPADPVSQRSSLLLLLCGLTARPWLAELLAGRSASGMAGATVPAAAWPMLSGSGCGPAASTSTCGCSLVRSRRLRVTTL